MTIKPIVPPYVELRCAKNADGTFNGGGYEDGRQLTDPIYRIHDGTCDDIRNVYKNLRDAYPKDVPIHVGSDCRDCLGQET